MTKFVTYRFLYQTEDKPQYYPGHGTLIAFMCKLFPGLNGPGLLGSYFIISYVFDPICSDDTASLP